jgi:chorismate synthase
LPLPGSDKQLDRVKNVSHQDGNHHLRGDVVLRQLEDMSDLKTCEVIQRLVWGFGNTEVVSSALIRAVVHGGGLAAGAFVGQKLVAFVFGLIVLDRGEPGLHSHMLGVLPGFRGMGIGQDLKWFQRDWCLGRGIDWVSWTFDPMQARNAKLNFEHLGVYGEDYLPDFYGDLGGELNAGLPTDRLMVRWDLAADHVSGLAAGEVRLQPSRPPATVGHGSTLQLDLDTDWVCIAIPEDIGQLKLHDAGQALLYQEELLCVMERYMARGYVPTRFLEGSYWLEKTG